MMASAAEKELAAFMAKYDPKIAKLGKAAFAHMQTRLPGAVSLVYDNYNALAIGFGPEGKAPPLSIALYPRWISLFFLFGAGLPDPDGLLQGKGSRVRSIRIDSVDRLDDPQIDTLITAAVLHAGWKLEPGKKNKVVIQSVSPTQRPRRP